MHLSAPPIAGEAASEAACRGLVTELAWLVDHGEIDAAIELFTADARIDRDGELAIGIDAIAAQFRARPPRRLTRHVLSNLDVTLTGAQTAQSRCYVTVYRHRWAGETPALPVPMTGPETLGEYHDHFRCEAGRWRIASRTVRSILDRNTPLDRNAQPEKAR